jgi:hypothetical protein
MVMTCHQNVEQNRNLLTANKSYANVTNLTFVNDSNKSNLYLPEIKNGLNSGDACYHSVRNILSSDFLPKTLKIQFYLLYNFTYCFVWV